MYLQMAERPSKKPRVCSSTAQLASSAKTEPPSKKRRVCSGVAQPVATRITSAAQPVPLGPSIEFPSSSPSFVIVNHGRTADSRGDDGAMEKPEAKIEGVRDIQRWLATENLLAAIPRLSPSEKLLLFWPGSLGLEQKTFDLSCTSGAS